MLQLHYRNIKKGPLWLVEPIYSVGKGDECDLTLNDDSIEPHHADVVVDDDQVSIVNRVKDDMVKVNGVVVDSSVGLRHGDKVQLGKTLLQLIDPKSESPIEEKGATERTWLLKATNTALAEREFPIEGTVVLGRANDCDISLGVTHLSRKHAKITETEEGLTVEDLNSSNGTFVNGNRITKSVLNSGDQLSLDALKFRVVGPERDLNSTTMRPAIQISQPAKSAQEASPAKRAKPRPEKARPAQKLSTETTREESTAPEESTAGSSKLIIGIILLLAVAGALWFVKR